MPKVHTAPATVLLSGAHSRITESHREVILDLDGLDRLLKTHDPGGAIAIPRVDFRSQMVVAEFLGTRPTTGYRVSVDVPEVTESDWLRIPLKIVEPGTACSVSQRQTQPFVIFAVERHPENILFESTRLVPPCQ
jgi:hypothetical protein